MVVEMDAIEFLQAIQDGKEYKYSDIDLMIEDEYERENARMVFADFVGAIGKIHLIRVTEVSDYDPRQPRDWRGRWTKTGGGGSTEWQDPALMGVEEVRERFNAASAEKELRESFGKSLDVGERADYEKLKERYEKEQVSGIPKDEKERIQQIERLGLIDRTPVLGPIDQYYYPIKDGQLLPEGEELEFWQEQIKGSDVAVAFHIDHVGEQIAADGFQNQHITGTSMGMNDPDGRKSLENGLWQIEGRPDEEYPVYGFLTPPNGDGLSMRMPVSQYGNAFAIMKPEVDEYTTFTMGDSLNNNMWWETTPEDAESFEYVRIPSPKLEPDPVALGPTYMNNGSALVPRDTQQEFHDGVEYIEAQIHGNKATLDNIREIRIPQDKSTIMERVKNDSDWRRPVRAFMEKKVPIMVPDGDSGEWVYLDKAEVDALIREGDLFSAPKSNPYEISEEDKAILRRLQKEGK